MGTFGGGEVKKKWGGLVPVVQVSLREIGNAQKKTNQRSTSTPTSKATGQSYFVTRRARKSQVTEWSRDPAAAYV